MTLPRVMPTAPKPPSATALMSFAAVLVFPVHTGNAQTPEMLSLDLYFEMESVSNARIAPDGLVA